MFRNVVATLMAVMLIASTQGLTVEELQTQFNTYKLDMQEKVQNMTQALYQLSTANTETYITSDEFDALKTEFTRNTQILQEMVTSSSHMADTKIYTLAEFAKNKLDELNITADTIISIQSLDAIPNGFCAIGAEKEGSDDVKYKTVMLNIAENQGTPYNTETGVFVCPVTGLYMFSITLHKGNSNKEHFQVGLYVDNVQRAVITADKESSSATIYSPCEKGKKVRVREYPDSLDIDFADDRFQLANSFCGYLMYRTDINDLRNSLN